MGGLATSASAEPITGVLNIVGSVQVTATTLDFVPPDEGGFGVFTTVEPPAPGDQGGDYFEDIVSPNPLTPIGGEALDLALVPTAGYQTVNIGDTFVDDFLQDFTIVGGVFPGYDYSNLTFDLTHVVDQSSAGQCTGAETSGTCFLGPFLLTAGEEGTGILLEVRGIFQDPSLTGCAEITGHVDACDWDDTPYVGRFTTQVGLTVQEILDIIEGGGTDPACGANIPAGTICASYSANFESAAAIPEPTTLLLFGTGAAALGYRRRRQARRNL
jgi:hypothetical protein